MTPRRAALGGCALLSALAAVVLTLALAPLEARGQSGDTILLHIAGDDVSATTMIPAIAKRFLESRGASSIQLTPAPAPWTSEVSGQLLTGERIGVLIRATNTVDGFHMLGRRTADIALAGRPVTPQEAQALARLGAGDMTSGSASYLMARTGATPTVNSANPVNTISFEQFRAAYAGRLTDWSALGGSGPIHVLLRAAGAASRDIIEASIMGSTRYGSQVRTYDSFEALGAALRADPQAIGYMPSADLAGAKAIRLRTDARLAPKPGEYALVTGDYPLSLQLLMYRAPNVHKVEIDDFFHEAQSIASQVDVMFLGYFRVGPQLLIPKVDNPVPAAYRAIADVSLRVSTTIRFPPNSTKIDAETERELDDLAAYLRFLDTAPEKVRLIAFSDNTGSDANNIAVSQKLGQIVFDELKERRANPGAVLPLGSEVPLASDFTPEGRRLNRRVETWIMP